MVIALRHGVWITGIGTTHLATGDHSNIMEPVEWSGDLASVAALRMACEDATAGRGVSSRQQALEASLNAHSVVEGFRGTKGPA